MGCLECRQPSACSFCRGEWWRGSRSLSWQSGNTKTRTFPTRISAKKINTSKNIAIIILCNTCVFRPVLAFGNLLFVHASTNATDDQKYSPFPSQILTVSKFCYHLAHSFSRKNVPFDFERGLFERLLPKPKGPFSEKMKLKKWHQNSWHWQKSAQSSEIYVTST